MADMFVLALLGHLLGDYMFQSKAMALKKSQKGFAGLAWCTAHVLIYTLCVMLIWRHWDVKVLGLVFAPHFVIDRWSLAAHWLRLIRGRTFESAYHSKEQYREFDIAFTCLIYAVVDNTMHLWCLYAVINLC